MGRSFTIFVERWRCWLVGEAPLANFLKDAPELWWWREAQSSIRVQEGEPPSFLIIARFESSARPENPKEPKAALTTPVRHLSVARGSANSPASITRKTAFWH